MQIPLPPDLQPTNEMLTLIAKVDEFKGEWRVIGSLGPETLRSLRRIATIESAGSSTRIEGAKLSDDAGDLSPLAGRLRELLDERASLSVGEATEALGANRNTLRDKFGELTEKRYVGLHGKGRGSHYRRVR